MMGGRGVGRESANQALASLPLEQSSCSRFLDLSRKSVSMLNITAVLWLLLSRILICKHLFVYLLKWVCLFFVKCGSSDLAEDEKKSDSELTADDLQSLEMLLGLVCRLVHLTTTTGEANDWLASIRPSDFVLSNSCRFRFHQSVLRRSLRPGLLDFNPVFVLGRSEEGPRGVSHSGHFIARSAHPIGECQRRPGHSHQKRRVFGFQHILAPS